MSGINPRRMGLELTPEERRAGRTARIESRLAVLERQSAKGLQRASHEDASTVSMTGTTAISTGTEVVVAVPSLDSMVMLRWQSDIWVNAGGGATIIGIQVTAGATSVVMAPLLTTGNAAPQEASPWHAISPSATVTPFVAGNVPATIFLTGHYLLNSLGVPVPDDEVKFELMLGGSIGTTQARSSDRHVWAAVL